MVTRSLLIINLLVVLCGFVQYSHAATINVRTDRNPISLNESFQIVFEAEGDLDDDPDFSPLENNFQVLSTVQSSNFSVINGRISSSKRWTITAMANTSGHVAIPSISFGQDKSPVINLDVRSNNIGTGNSQAPDEIYLEASATPQNPYVQSQVIYTLKLYRAVAIAKASLAEPEVIVGDAVLERLDDDKSYETSVNGRSYHVIERNYAIYPQSSGEVNIAPINFMGQITRSRFGVDPFGAPPRTVVRRSQSIDLNVRSIPDTFTGTQWLPAENLNIAEEWSGDPLTLRVGEPITRTLILTARGLISSQLPELSNWSVADLKFYPDRAQLDDEKSDSGIISTRHEKAAIIPNQPGVYVLPEIAIPWWNTLTDRLENAIVPERTIQVLPAISINTGQPEITSLIAPIQPVLNAPEDNVTITDNETTMTDTSESQIWKWSTLLLAVIWIITLIVWWQKPRQDSAKANNIINGDRKLSHGAAEKKVLAACDINDPVEVKNALLEWGKAVWLDAPPVGLGEIALRTNNEMRDHIHGLNSHLYSSNPNTWDAGEFKSVFVVMAKSLEKNTNKVQQDQGQLQPLYKL